MELNFFGAPEYLEPHCPGCKAKIDYGVTTIYDDTVKGHKCLACGILL
ncbi:hypothetical protein J4227_05825 [Candidatus Woesearchaeota archaeon]|nr:hypothetical protein [Candidatus Woesearchaeota archaeon]